MRTPIKASQALGVSRTFGPDAEPSTPSPPPHTSAAPYHIASPDGHVTHESGIARSGLCPLPRRQQRKPVLPSARETETEDDDVLPVFPVLENNLACEAGYAAI